MPCRFRIARGGATLLRAVHAFGWRWQGQQYAEGRLCDGRAEHLELSGLTCAYAYRLTPEYPYMIGCFSGQVMRETHATIRQAMGPARVRASGQTLNHKSPTLDVTS
jgi:hypothetical protein